MHAGFRFPVSGTGKVKSQEYGFMKKEYRKEVQRIKKACPVRPVAAPRARAGYARVPMVISQISRPAVLRVISNI